VTEMLERDVNFEDPVLQKKYEEAMERLGPAGRVARSASLFSQMYRMIGYTVAKENPQLSTRELRRRIALRLYQGDTVATKRLEQLK